MSLRVWLIWTLRDPWDALDPRWVARLKRICAEDGVPYPGENHG